MPKLKNPNPKCVQCGKTLIRHYKYEFDSASKVKNKTPTDRFGYRGEGLFCSLECGYQWARERAKHPARALKRKKGK